MAHSEVTARLSVRLTPRARQAGIAGFEGDVLHVRVAAPPVDGRANEALAALLAKALGIPKRDVRVVAGQASRQKVVAIDGLTNAEVLRRLEAAQS
jgi:uncharacterized protein (TIGR00251 family)